ncbi:hypothetical protein J2T09_004626 [Neorhizobium huautlense]|uniref:Uncharacterized protein n=1 Tax=Neorhizobium huautlense TaxID=67774 RepID=A0ABT9PZD6_9HYPH|nr:hypothetical protein [Neorhizobium huautlense]MDP9839846.1 hypothetical protein [Neorhizobium huautlense]
MDDVTAVIFTDQDLEILPPEHAAGANGKAEPCLCCGCAHVVRDEDGCGICDQCLSP